MNETSFSGNEQLSGSLGSNGLAGRWGSLYRKVAQWLTSASLGLTIEEGLQRRADNFLAIRIIAAAMVIYGHAGALAPAVHSKDIFLRMGWHIYSGDIAVDTFFLISGYLVTGSWLRTRSLVRFFSSRFLRLIPAYLVLLLILTWAYGPVLTNLPLGQYFSDPRTAEYFFTNIKLGTDMSWHLPGVFDSGLKSTTINGSIWTLPAEARMYVFLGLGGALGLLYSPRLAGLLIALLLAAGIIYPQWVPLPKIYLHLAGYFVLGIMIYLYRGKLIISLPIVFAAILLSFITNKSPIYSFTFPIALSASIFGIAYLTKPLAGLEKLGDPSYGIYLWGWPMQQVIAISFAGAGRLIHWVLALTLAAMIGYASWHFIEKPAMRLKMRKL